MKKRIGIMALVLTGIVLPASAEQSMAGMAMEGKTAQAGHQGRGKVISVDKATLTVKLEHEAIKSLGWPGMTMDFKVADAALLEGIKKGDTVRFEMRQTKSKKWEVVKIDRK